MSEIRTSRCASSARKKLRLRRLRHPPHLAPEINFPRRVAAELHRPRCHPAVGRERVGRSHVSALARPREIIHLRKQLRPRLRHHRPRLFHPRCRDPHIVIVRQRRPHQRLQLLIVKNLPPRQFPQGICRRRLFAAISGRRRHRWSFIIRPHRAARHQQNPRHHSANNRPKPRIAPRLERRIGNISSPPLGERAGESGTYSKTIALA